jgi:hypothetical protein
MITATTARANTHSIREALTYINSLVSGATENGEYCVFVDGKIFDDAMAHALSSSYGYNVTKSYNDMGTFPTYKISWVPVPEIPGQSAIFFSCDVNGGSRWFYGLLDFKNGQAIDLVDTGLNLSDYNIDSSYVLQNKGYVYVFRANNNSNVQLFFINSEGSLVEQYTGSTDNSYDVLSGIWFYFDDQNNGTVRAFNGDVVYTLDYDHVNQDFYVDWDGEGATRNGTFQYTLFDDNDGTDSIRIVKPDGSMTEIANLDLSLYYHNCYIYMDYICLVTYQSSGDNNVLSLKFYDYLGNLIRNIDTSSYSYSNYDFNEYGDNKASFLFYDNGDVNVDYRHINYDFTNNVLVSETITRSSQYENWNTYRDSPHMYSSEYEYMKNIYYLFYGNTNEIVVGFSSLDYAKFYYLEDGDTSGNTYVFTNDGEYTKSIDYWSFQGVRDTLKFTYDDGVGNLKFMFLKSTGNLTRETNILLSDVDDAGWSVEFGDYMSYTIQTYDGDDYFKTLYILKYDNSEYETLGPALNYDTNWNSYYNILLISDNNNGSYYYFNKNSNGVQLISSGLTMNVNNQNYYYTSDNIMKSKVVLHFPDSNEIKILTEDSLSSTISLPAQSYGAYSINVMEDFFVYLYIDGDNSNNLTAKAYDYSGNLLNTIDTGISDWAEGWNSAKNRFWFSQYTGSGMLTYYGFGPSNLITTTLSDYSENDDNIDDFVWWD